MTQSLLADQASLWSNARTWEELLDLNRRYLNGEIRVSTSCIHPIDTETNEILSGLLRLADFDLLTTSSQPEVREGVPKYINREAMRTSLSPGPLPRERLAYVQGQLHRIKKEFIGKQLKNNDMAVLLTVRAREHDHIDMLGTYHGNEIVDSGNPGTTQNIAVLYEGHRTAANAKYVHFLIPTTHPDIPLKAVIRFIECLKDHKKLVVAFQYEMYGEGPQRQPPAHRIQDPAALELFGQFNTTVPLADGFVSFYCPVAQSRVGTSRSAVLNVLWVSQAFLGLDHDEHIQGMLFGHYNKKAYPADVYADPVAVLVGTLDFETNIDLLALIESILLEEGLHAYFGSQQAES